MAEELHDGEEGSDGGEGFQYEYVEADEYEDEFEDDFEHEDGYESEGQQELSGALNGTIDVTDPSATTLLSEGEIEVLGRMPWSSNGTYLVTVEHDDDRAQAIYKPESGERPLWDFPQGLWRREVAAHVLARDLGWEIVPPTVQRSGPFGVGSVQFFVPARFEEHYFTFKDIAGHRRALEQLCLLDLVSNNTDRKGGHILLSESDHLWGIDHGLSFHEEFKLRTVIWDFAGDPIPADLAADIVAWVEAGPTYELAALLSDAEIEAMLDRTAAVLGRGVFPHDPTGRRYPWPLV